MLHFLEYVPECFAWKNNNVAIFDPTRKVFRSKAKYDINGVSDILGIYKSRFLAVEVKTPEEHRYIIKHYDVLRAYSGEDKKKKRYRDQIRFIENIQLQGGIAFFASDVDQIKEKLGLGMAA